MSPRTLGRPRPLYATCDAGGEEALATELRKLRCQEVEPAHRGVYFWGGEEEVWKVNLYSRLANRVLLPLSSFPAEDRHALYDACKKIRWDWWVHTSQTIAVDASSHRSMMNHTHFIAQVVKDAVVDSMRERFDERPSVDAKQPDLPINARISDNICTISLDTSGARLHRRSYRQDGGIAPMKETLASLLNHLIAWRPHEPIIDLTCGSGTILLEAALRAQMIPVGSLRLEADGFAFQAWRSHSQTKFDTWWTNRPQSKPFAAHFWGSDISRKQISRAQANASRAGVAEHIHFTVGEFNQSAQEAAQWLENRLNSDLPQKGQKARKAVLLMNLPYGERLESHPEEAVKLFRDLGQQLKAHFQGCEAWLLVADDSPWREVGLKPKKQIQLKNGGIPVRLVQFPLYR